MADAGDRAKVEAGLGVGRTWRGGADTAQARSARTCASTLGLSPGTAPGSRKEAWLALAPPPVGPAGRGEHRQDPLVPSLVRWDYGKTHPLFGNLGHSARPAGAFL